MQELIDKFSLEHCSKSGAKFDFKKGIWFNHEYLKQLDDEALADLVIPMLEERGLTGFDRQYVGAPWVW